MKTYQSNHIKNVGLFGHAGSGKTTLAETMLFESGYINRRGNVEDGNTVSDYTEIEHERGNSLFSTLMHLEWKQSKINLLDTPGLDDFTGEVVSTLKVVDTGVLVLNAQYGVEVGSEMIWETADKMNKPMIAVVNQLDQEHADYEKTVEQAKNRFGNKIVVFQYPLQAGTEFNAIVDVLRMTVYKFGPDGGKPEKLPIPDAEKAKADELHNLLVEAAAENDEGLMELYFEKGTLDEDELQKGLQIAMRQAQIVPLFCVSAKYNMGSGRIMGFIDNVCPTAAEMPPAALESGETLVCDSKGQLVAFIYKTISEPHLGDMAYFKVYSGSLESGKDYINVKTGAHERINQLFVMNGKKRDQTTVLHAGDIGATVKLKNTHTNNSLTIKGNDQAIEPIHFPPSRIREAIHPVQKGDEEKMSMALNVIHEEDPTIIVEHSNELKQIIVHGQGELHLHILQWKLEHVYKVKVEFERPRIPYRETIQKAVKSSYRHKKQSGGAGQFAEVYMLVEPWYEGMPAPEGISVRKSEEHDLDWGGKIVFNNCIVGGSIDAKFMAAILKGIMEKMTDGPLTGSYVRDVRVSIYDGKMHPVDSNDMAFKTAGMMAFRDAFRDASPKILEPIFNIQVLVPDEMTGDVMRDLLTRRANIMGVEADGHYQKINARIPLSELYKYSSVLRSLTQGRAKHNREFAEYAPIPMDLQKNLIQKHQQVLEEA